MDTIEKAPNFNGRNLTLFLSLFIEFFFYLSFACLFVFTCFSLPPLTTSLPLPHSSRSAGNFPMISDDLVNSYHLLLCALDLVFTNALLCNARKDLLNPDFRGTLNYSPCSYSPL